MERRQRLRGDGVGEDQRRLRLVLAVLAFLLLTAEIPLAERRSGYEFMGRETRAMQDDDTTNPALLWVLDGEALFKTHCSRCHQDMKGVAARYPKAGVSLDQKINHSLKKPLPYESRELLALTAYVAMQSRGMSSPRSVRRKPLSITCPASVRISITSPRFALAGTLTTTRAIRSTRPRGTRTA